MQNVPNDQVYVKIYLLEEFKTDPFKKEDALQSVHYL